MKNNRKIGDPEFRPVPLIYLFIYNDYDLEIYFLSDNS